MASKLHSWCTQFILLLLEISNTDIQVVSELFIYDVHTVVLNQTTGR